MQIAKVQTSLCIRVVRSVLLLFAYWQVNYLELQTCLMQVFNISFIKRKFSLRVLVAEPYLVRNPEDMVSAFEAHLSAGL